MQQKPKQLMKAPLSSSVPNQRIPMPTLGRQSGFKKSLSIGLVALSLLAGGLILNHNYETENKKPKLEVVNQTKEKFIKALFEIKDDQHEDIRVKKNALQQAPHVHENEMQDSHHDFPAIVEMADTPHHMMDQQVDQQVSPASEEVNLNELSNTAPSEDDERLRALQSESLLASTSHEVESVHKADLDKSKFRYQMRVESYKRSLEAQRQIASTNPTSIQPANPLLGSYKKALTKCSIPGHDVHWINDLGWILSHVKIQDMLVGNEAIGRNIIKEKGRVAVIVYESGYEVYDSKGVLLETGGQR